MPDPYRTLNLPGGHCSVIQNTPIPTAPQIITVDTNFEKTNLKWRHRQPPDVVRFSAEHSDKTYWFIFIRDARQKRAAHHT